MPVFPDGSVNAGKVRQVSGVICVNGLGQLGYENVGKRIVVIRHQVGRIRRKGNGRPAVINRHTLAFSVP